MRGESMKGKSKKSTYSTTFGVDPNLPLESTCRMRGETMKDKSKKSTYSTTFGVDPKNAAKIAAYAHLRKNKIFQDQACI